MKDSLCCCVCLKEEPFENNPIVSCDGKNCSTAVHKACYGIQQIPDGAWFCQKCISQERTARVRCELCPSRDGALKHTNKGGWCHIICALFVQGAEFLDTERLETISVDKVASDKLNKMCTICEKNNRLDRATVGACIQCVKSGCKILFHVTCAQSQGLLTEIVNSKDGVRYVAYCFTHKQKTKHRDFSIRLFNSSHLSNRHDKNKLRQTPPQLEKSDEDCVTPQDVSLDLDLSVSSQTMNISSSSGNANLSSDSTSMEDSVDHRIAPVLCNTSEIREFQNKKFVSKTSCVPQSRKSLDVLRAPNITASESLSITDHNSLPPNLYSSDVLESITKEEPSFRSGPCSAVSDSSNFRQIKRQATTSSSDLQCKKSKIIKSEPKTIIKSEIGGKPEKIKRTRKFPQATKSKFEMRKDKKIIPPSRPMSLFNHMSNFIGGTSIASSSTGTLSTSTTSTTNKITNIPCQSMEELLEWQWDQTGTLLMQQAEASDIASLLSCLHDLKNENEQLLSKHFKLSHRRDHLKAVNAKLQLQLTSKTSMYNSINQTTNAVTSVTSAIDTRTVNKPVSTSTVQAMTKNISKTQKFMDTPQHGNQVSSMSNLVNGDVRNRQMSVPQPSATLPTDNKSIFIQSQQMQQQQQHQQMLSNSGCGGGSSTSLPKIEQGINPQTLALLKQYQHQQHQGFIATPVTQSIPNISSVPSIISQTDLVNFLNNQLHSQLTSNTQISAAGVSTTNPTAVFTPNPKSISQDLHIAPNNGSNMELIYQAIQQKKQQQQQQQLQQQPVSGPAPPQLQIQQHTLPSHFFYNTNKMSTQSGGMIASNNLDSSLSQNPDVQVGRYQLGNQRPRPSETLYQQIRAAKPHSD